MRFGTCGLDTESLNRIEIELNGNAGYDLTKVQEENLEKNGYLFARKGGRMPARQLNGLQIQKRIDGYALDLAASVTRWGVISAQSGEFIVPDVPLHGIIPLTPRLALVQSAPDGMIVERNVAEINQAMRATSRDYFFARMRRRAQILTIHIRRRRQPRRLPSRRWRLSPLTACKS
jgi:hypothetical protein